MQISPRSPAPKPFARAERVEDRHLVRRNRAADARIAEVVHPVIVFLPRQVNRQVARVAGRLAQAVAVQNRNAELVLEGFRQTHRQRARPADQVAEVAQILPANAVAPDRLTRCFLLRRRIRARTASSVGTTLTTWTLFAGDPLPEVMAGISAVEHGRCRRRTAASSA